MHFALEFNENGPVVEVGVREEAIQASHYLEQVLGGAGRDGHSGCEVAVVLDDRCGVVQRVNHIVDGGTLLR